MKTLFTVLFLFSLCFSSLHVHGDEHVRNGEFSDATRFWFVLVNGAFRDAEAMGPFVRTTGNGLEMIVDEIPGEKTQPASVVLNQRVQTLQAGTEYVLRFEVRGMRVRISEAGISHAGPIAGSVLEGEWTEELQADYLRRFLTVLYSHPNVDGVNFWGFGPRNWQAHIGLLDRDYEPRPAFEELRRLVREVWRTRETLQTNRAGEARLTGFHGEYRITARLPDGTGAEGAFSLSADTRGRVTVTLRADGDVAAGSLPGF